MKRLVIGVLVGFAVGAAPAHAVDIEKQVRPSSAVQRVLPYLPRGGEIVKVRQATRHVIHARVIEPVTPRNNPIPFVDGIPEGAVWDTIYTVRFGKRQVLLCIGGLGVIKRFSR